MINFNPKSITKSLVSGLNERSRDVVLQRFGLGDAVDKKTLESIGQGYGITRERVRQIENVAINSIRQSESFKSTENILDELNNALSKERGGVAAEHDILDYLADDPSKKNHIHFLFVLGDSFTKIKEDEDFYHHWTNDESKAEKVHRALKNLHDELHQGDLMSENEIVSRLTNYIETELKEKIRKEVALSWLNISKAIDMNALGEYGHVSSSSIRPRGIRDLAFLVLKQNGSPLHFTEVAKKISELFPRSAHPETAHNELIKDDRFVLVGRGLYALAEWGYSRGVVRDIITNILKSVGPTDQDEIIKRVLKERYVKENTILVNLRNSEHFKKDAKGRYTLA